jgi:hypothetical protein
LRIVSGSAPGNDAAMNRSKSPSAKPNESEPRALGEDDTFGEKTYARGLKAVTEAIEQLAAHPAVSDTKKKNRPAPKKTAKRK